MSRAERIAGFTLVEAVLVMALLALLAAMAWPAFHTHLQRARRADAVLALLQLQQHQARWRAAHPAYADAGALGSPGQSPDGHYHLTVAEPGPFGVDLFARADGTQRNDRSCATFQLRVLHGDSQLLSFRSDGAPNPDLENRRCWGR